MPCEYSLMLGDSLATLQEMPAGIADALVTDPPFTAAGGSTNGRSAGRAADTQFFLYWLAEIMRQCQRVVRPDGCALICCDWRTLDDVVRAVRAPGVTQTGKCWEVTQAIVWDRGSIGLGSPFRNQFEMIAFARGPDFDRGDRPRDRSNVIRERWPYGQHKHHPAEKPPQLFRPLLELALWGKPGGVVLDPFAGSGSVGVAAAMEGLSYLGIEVDATAYGVAQERLSVAYASGPAEAPVKPQMGLFA